MLIPSYSSLTDDAQKRLKAIEEFSSIGSGLNIAMRDLDIRGAGNILGAEQSGFISDIGYDMYHKILNEAIDELKETEFHDLFQQEIEENRQYVKECVIETDLEVLLPDSYVTSVSERLLLYKELNDLSSEDELQTYRLRLIDRFGPIPRPTEELIKTISLFYQSPNFMQMIRYAQTHPQQVHLRETPQRLTLVCDQIESISQAISRIEQLTQTDVN